MDVKHIGDTEIVQLAPPAPIDPTYEPKVAIQKLPATGPLEDLLAVLDRDGGLILEDLVSMEQLAAIQKELDECKGPVEEAPVNEALVHIPKQTILVPAIVGRSKTIQELCELPVLEKLRDHCLKDISTIVREDSTVTQTINPLLSCSFSFQITTGAPRQRLHRDDNVHHIKHDQPFDLKKVSQFACLIAGCDTTRENGATMFVPGSHRWGDDRHPKTDEVCFAEMKAGSALIFLASSYHGGGHNSQPNSRRVVHGLFFCRGNLRQEENQFLSVPFNKVKDMSSKILELLGYKKPSSALGIVDNKCPTSDLEATFRNVMA